MTDRLSLRTHWGYGFGDFGQNLVFQTLAIFLLPFYTEELGLSPALAGLIFLIARPIDGVTDPIMGYLAQRYRSRWGSFRPFLMYGALPVALAFGLLFWKPELGETGRFWFAFGTYLLFGLCFTAINIPYGALTAVMTRDYHERGRLTGFRMSFALLGGIVAGYVTPKVLESAGAYGAMAVLYGGILIVSLLVSFFSVRELRTNPQNTSSEASLRDTFRMLRRNGPFWQLTLSFGCCFAALMAFAGTIDFYFSHYVGDKSGMATALLFFTVSTAVSVPGWTWLSRRVGKRNTFLLGVSLSVLAFLLAYTLAPTSRYALFACFALHGLGNGAAALTSWAMPADTIEYGEWKSGVRTTGMTYGIYGVGIKLGMGIGASLLGFALSHVGYVANQVQTPEAVAGIRALQTLLPAALLTIALAAMWFYPLSEQRHVEIKAALEEREQP